MNEKKIDLLVAEVGSTTTTVNAFHNLDGAIPEFIGQGISNTTVEEGNVKIGLEQAIGDLEDKLKSKISWSEFFASSSAAGGLKMSVHGLVYQMTVKAAEEAALGAGAVVKLVTAGEITTTDLRELAAIRPNIILLAGGVDYGEKSTVLKNAHILSQWLEENKLKLPVVYAGNRAASREVEEIFKKKSIAVQIVENVYPKIDQLNVQPTRRAIQQAFSEHIVEAEGMEKIRQLVDGEIMPTPGAVMNAALLLAKSMPDVLVFDVGGATTDVYSVTEGTEKIQRILLNPEPIAKRTVEGDLGVYVNAQHLVKLLERAELTEEFGENYLELIKPIPKTASEIAFAKVLTEKAIRTALLRHVGRWRSLYGPTGRQTVAEGKDLTNIKWVVGTGGALVRLPDGDKILPQAIKGETGKELLPEGKVQFMLDKNYIMASAGVMAKKYPQAAIKILSQSLDQTGQGGGCF